MTPTSILCVNAGSSSLKFNVYAVESAAGEPRGILAGEIEAIGQPMSRRWVVDSSGAKHKATCDAPDHAAASRLLFQCLAEHGVTTIAAVGHRLVHGGVAYDAPALVDRAMLARLQQLIPFAPLHLPSELALIESISREYAGIPQVACFDTSFHRSMPEIAQRFALPIDLWNAGLRRYGFHGISYESVVATLGPEVRERTVIAHLGQGSSLVAVRAGKPIDTTMGFTPTGGVAMGTRTGDLDPGVLLHLLRDMGRSVAEVERLVNFESGVLALSETSSDMKTLLELAPTDRRAQLAIDIYCYQVRKAIGGFAAALGGLELLVFAGGIGENAAPIRESICAGLGFLGIAIDPSRNGRSDGIISSPPSACAVRVVRTDEALVIARHVRRIVSI